MSLAGFGRHRRREENRSRRKRGSRGGRYWTKIWRPPHADDNKTGIPVVFPAADYLEPDPEQAEKYGKHISYFPYVEHAVQIPQPNFRMLGSSLCTAGWDKNNRQPCACCYAIDQGTPRGVVVTTSQRTAVNVGILDWFHLVPQTARDGSPVLYTRGDRKGEQVMAKEPCEGRNCKHCRSDYERVFGAKRYMSLGSNFFEHLRSIEDTLSQRCLCGGYLTTLGYECPFCGELAIDIETSQMSDQEIASALERPQKCPHCGESPHDPESGVSLFMPRNSCDGENCPNPERPPALSLMPDEARVPTVVWLNRTGKGTSTTLNMNRFKPATEFIVPTNDDVLLALDEDEDGHDVLHWNKDIANFVEPFDFEGMFQATADPQTLNKQVETLRKGIPDFRNPYETGDEMKDYGNPTGTADYT